MDGVLNEYTETVHRHEPGAGPLHTACGVSYNLSPDKLRKIAVEHAVTDHDASKCGRCFEDGGSY